MRAPSLHSRRPSFLYFFNVDRHCPLTHSSGQCGPVVSHFLFLVTLVSLLLSVSPFLPPFLARIPFALIVRGRRLCKKKREEWWKITKLVGHMSKNMNRRDRGGRVGASLSWHLLPEIGIKKESTKSSRDRFCSRI